MNSGRWGSGSNTGLGSRLFDTKRSKGSFNSEDSEVEFGSEISESLLVKKKQAITNMLEDAEFSKKEKYLEHKRRLKKVKKSKIMIE